MYISGEKFILVAFFLFLAATCIFGIKTQRFIHNSDLTTASIYDIQYRNVAGNSSMTLYVRFNVDGRVYKSSLRGPYIFSAPFNIGDSINILYLQSSPATIKPYTIFRGWEVPAIFAFFTLLFGFFYYEVKRKK